MMNYAFGSLAILAAATLLAIIANHKRPLIPFFLTPILLVSTFTIYSAFNSILGKPDSYEKLEPDDYIIFNVLTLDPKIYVTLGHKDWETPKFFWLPATEENREKMGNAKEMIEQQGVSEMQIVTTDDAETDVQWDVGNPLELPSKDDE